MARLKERGLRKSVGVPGLFATAYGNVGSSIYYALGLVAAHALGLTPVVFIFAGGLFALTAKTYAEGASMFPEAGGSSSFARHAFNEAASFFAGWGQSLDYIITVAISAFFVPHYLGAFFPALGHGPGDVIGGGAVIGILALLNLRGLGESTKLNIFLAITDLLTQTALVGIGAALILDPGLLVRQVDLGVAPSYEQLLFAISIISISALPVTQDASGEFSTALGTTYKDDPVLGIVSALQLSETMETVARYYIGVLAATILIIATNAALIGISRLAWSQAEHRQLPPAFSRLHASYRTPWITISFFSVLAMLLLIPGETDFLGNLYAFGAMLSFTTAHLSIISLRLREPDRDRPYRAPWNVSIRGRPVPMTAVLGALGTGAAFASVAVLHDDARLVGTIWMLAGMAMYVVYRRTQGLDLSSVYTIERPQRPLDFLELTYRSALVPIFGTDVDTDAMSRAAALVGPDAEVEALYVLRVPSELELGAGMEDEEERARNVLEVARLQARTAGLKVRVKLIRTRNPGASIVEAARERRSDVIYICTDHAPSDERLLGPTTRYVLGHRPCRVVVESEPESAHASESGQASGPS